MLQGAAHTHRAVAHELLCEPCSLLGAAQRPSEVEPHHAGPEVLLGPLEPYFAVVGPKLLPLAAAVPYVSQEDSGELDYYEEDSWAEMPLSGSG